MGVRRGLAAAVAVVLALAPAPAVAQPSTPVEVPCPRIDLDPPPARPRQPDPPPHRPGDREVGGPRLATAGLVVPAGAPTPPELTARSWLVADLDRGTVLGACGPHEYGLPASTQKLLLAAALLPVLDPRQVVEVTAEDLDIPSGSSAVGLLVGGRYTVETLWLGLLLNSGNDAANALARIGGGPEGVAGGVRRMNDLARRLGAYQTHAVTPSGLDGPGQFTSAYDLALIARPLFEREDFLRYVATERARIPPQPPEDPDGFEIQNQNGLLLNYPGAIGGKTGFTQLARHSFVGAAERDGRRLVVTLLGAEAQPLRGWQQAAALLDWGFALPPEAAVGRLVEPGELTQVAVSATEAPAVPVAAVSPSPDPVAAGPARQFPVAVMLAVVTVVVLGGLAYLVVTRPRRAR